MVGAPTDAPTQALATHREDHPGEVLVSDGIDMDIVTTRVREEPVNDHPDDPVRSD
jgi:hypothetical protein